MLTVAAAPGARRRAPARPRCGGALLERHGIEVGGGLGPLAGRIWRIGLMGENARLASVESLLRPPARGRF